MPENRVGSSQVLWSSIRNRRVGFPEYAKVVDAATGAAAYDRLKHATERYLAEGSAPPKSSDPYLLELIWSYWHEEGMLVQTIGAIGRRFQNVKEARDPLGAFEVEPLRPLGNLLWGYIQDEPHRLTSPRRAYEYDHHYGLRLGSAATVPRSPDPRSRFTEGFHGLLQACSTFFERDDAAAAVGDELPVLNALRATHLVLSEGAHNNQFGDLPSTARVEMLMEMWLLARPEIREFLGGRIAVPYPEPWMDAVDRMKKLLQWGGASIRAFHDLGVYGEQLVLSIRHDNWSARTEPASAARWARHWRPEIQGYIRAYRAVTAVEPPSSR